MNIIVSNGGHPMMNHVGRTIFVTQSTLRTLDMLHYLKRNSNTGLLQMKPNCYPVYLELEGNGKHNRIFQELGPDVSGPNVAICRCRECQRKLADLDDIRHSKVRTEHMIQDMKAAQYV